jgi:hypothetical protein
MKRFLGLCIALVGGVICIWAGSSLLMTGRTIVGYHAVYAGLVGIAVLVVGLTMRQD